jgi:hypothetical protein
VKKFLNQLSRGTILQSPQGEFRKLSRRETQQLIAERNFARREPRVALLFQEIYGKIKAYAECSSEVFNNPLVFPPDEYDKIVATNRIQSFPKGICVWDCSLAEAVELAGFLESYRSSWVTNSSYIFAHRCKIYVAENLGISFCD